MESQPKQSSSFTEKYRADNFKNSSEQWEEQSTIAVNILKKLFDDPSNDFFTIFEAARQQRALVAKELGHEPLIQFGEKRIELHRQAIGDKYSPDASPHELYSAIQAFLNSQLQNFLFKNLTQDQQRYFLYTADGWLLTYDCPSHMNASITPKIEAKYPIIDEKRYLESLELLNVELHALRAAIQNEDKFLFRLGLLIYDLARINLLTRGSASTSLWIGTAIGGDKFKNFNFKHIDGIPFDMYAQLQLNRKQYAIDFAKSIKPTFKEDQRYMTLSILERTFLKLFIEKLIAIWNTNNSSLAKDNEFTKDLKNLIETDFDSLSSAFHRIKDELSSRFNNSMRQETKDELKKFAKYTDQIINALEIHTQFDRQFIEGNFSTNEISLVITFDSLKWFRDDPDYFFSNKKKIFINTIITGFQNIISSELDQPYNRNYSKKLFGNFTFFKNIYHSNNPLILLIGELEALKHNEWHNPLDALLAIDKIFSSDYVIKQISKEFHFSMQYEQNELLKIIDQLKNSEAIELVMLKGNFSFFEERSKKNISSSEYRP